MWTLQGETITVQSNIGGATGCNLLQWCYIAGQIERIPNQYRISLFETSLSSSGTFTTTATKTSFLDWTSTAPLLAPTNTIVLGGSTNLPFVNSFDGYLKDIRVYRSPLGKNFLSNQGFEESGIYGSEEFLMTYIKINDTAVDYLADYGRTSGRYPVPKARLVTVTTTPTFCSRRYFYDCVTVPDYLGKAVIPDSSYLTRITTTPKEYFKLVSASTDPRVFTYATKNFLSLTQTHCARGTYDTDASLTPTFSSLSTDAGETFGGIGPGFYKICIYSEIEETFFHIGSFNIPESPLRSFQTKQVWLQALNPPTVGFSLEVYGHNPFSLNEKIYFASSCDKLVSIAPASLAANHLTATRLDSDKFLFTFVFSKPPSSVTNDETRLESGTLHLCSQPNYASTAFP